MNLREAAQQALGYLEQHAIISGIPIRDALRAALEPVTTCHELSKEGDKLSLPFDHFADAGKMVGKCAYPECLSTNGCEKQCPAFPRSKDDNIPDAGKMVATINELETIEPVAWLIESYDIYAKRTLQRLVFDNPKNMQGVKITAYYTTPPKRKPLTDKDIDLLRQGEQRLNFVTLREFRVIARAIERAHGIGGKSE